MNKISKIFPMPILLFSVAGIFFSFSNIVFAQQSNYLIENNFVMKSSSENIFDYYQKTKDKYLYIEVALNDSNVLAADESMHVQVNDTTSVKVKETLVKKNLPPKNLNTSGGGIGLPGPILSEIKVVNGKNVCEHKKDKPKKSKKNPKGHIDGECCLDPGETPNSLCYYPQAQYGKLIQKYLNNGKK